MKLNTIFVTTQLDVEDVIEGLSTWDYSEAIKFILALDLRFADVEFTEALVTELLASLKCELAEDFKVEEYLK